mmetsp:Transcript_45835/g.129674  ORF Transcript_45835/g.129674 Transcript_45835/m.129674 type:complete len:225 (-) Transcript_45835:62-736(-)
MGRAAALPERAGVEAGGDVQLPAANVHRRPRRRGQAQEGEAGGGGEVPAGGGPLARGVHRALRRGGLHLRAGPGAREDPRHRDGRGREAGQAGGPVDRGPREAEGPGALRAGPEEGGGEQRGLPDHERALPEGVQRRGHGGGDPRPQGPLRQGGRAAGEGDEDERRVPHAPHAARAGGDGCEARRDAAQHEAAEVHGLHERHRAGGQGGHEPEGHRRQPEAADH